MVDDVPSLVQIIGNVGFPIGVTLYLLVRFEKKIDVLSDSILKLLEVINNNASKEGKNK
ncbi:MULTISPECIES: YvrJ family protein [unclassified Paenibacillus]|uniref:YvrJ family protein n=1 Tax=unclassified Paenibacillus TaxID=185978 RepID=UPI0030F87587